MNVYFTDRFWAELANELAGDNRPTQEDFKSQVLPIVELSAMTLWGDEAVTPTVDDTSGVRYVRWDLIPPHMFPPGVAYAIQIDGETVVVDGVDIEWEYWDQVTGPYEPKD